MRTHLDPAADLVVLLDEDGHPRGTAPRAEVHTAHTPLHLAFSCYVFDTGGRLLLTRRALGKRAWPGVWTNSFCGHPRPDEPMEEAVHRYAEHELGVELTGLTCLLPAFRYRATDAGGTVENEVCPVFSATAASTVDPNPDEVVESRWIGLDELAGAIAAAPWALSPWMLRQVAEVAEAGGWHEPADLAQR